MVAGLYPLMSDPNAPTMSDPNAMRGRAWCRMPHDKRVDAGKVREAHVGDPGAPPHVQRVDASEVREARVGDPGASAHVQRADAGEVREARVGDPGAPTHVQRLQAREARKVLVPEARPPLHVCRARAWEARAPRREGARYARLLVMPARGRNVRAAQAAHQAQRARVARGEEAKYTLTRVWASTPNTSRSVVELLKFNLKFSNFKF